MKLKKYIALGCSLVIALGSLFTLAFGSVAEAQGTTRYWCDFSSNSSFSIPSNWSTNSNCSGGTGAPQTGDLLVFDYSHLNSAIDVNNDMSGLDVNSITFQGNGSAGYILTGNVLSLDAGIADNGSNGITNSVNLPITLTAAQTISSSGGNDTLNLGSPGNINLNSFSLSFNTNTTHSIIISSLSGSGSLIFSSPSGSTVNIYKLISSNSSLSASVTIDNNAQVLEEPGVSLDALGSGKITVNSGGSLELEDSSASGTLSNNLVLSGSGNSDGAAISSCLDFSSNCTSGNSVLTLSGSLTLQADSEVVNGAYNGSSQPANSATFNFTGNVTYNCHHLSGVSGSNTIVNAAAFSCPTPASSSSGSQTTNVKAPNTGEGMITNHSFWLMAGAGLIATAIVLLSMVLSKRYKG